MYETPFTDHLVSSDFEKIYEPVEDTFLLLDALEKEADYINSLKLLYYIL